MAGKRGIVQGWSAAAAKNNVKFLRSVELDQLSGTGFCFTLTLKHCPATGDDWHKLRRAFLKRMERQGMTRLHWVTEWQRRGVPHLHGVAYFDNPAPLQVYKISEAWLDLASSHGAKIQSQHVAVINNALGWLKYLAKHAARGVSHYQRSPENIPDGWAKTGRVWGHTGDWPVRDGLKLHLDNQAFFRFRRMVQRWRLADARESGNQRRIQTAKVMLRDRNRVISELRGVSEWIPADLALLMTECAVAQGGKVEA